jgi:hypothetical protein
MCLLLDLIKGETRLSLHNPVTGLLEEVVPHLITKDLISGG